MLLNLCGHSKKITFNGMTGFVSSYTAKELKAKYGKEVKIENMVKRVKKNLNGPVKSIPVSEYLGLV